jgi:tRNA(Ile)-lysidine synthase
MDVVAHLRDWPWPMPVGEAVVVGVSGGVDSMVLAEGMVRAGFSRLVVAHLHHCLRGAEADGDEALVRDWAARCGCACEIARVDVAARAAQDGHSIETTGRLARRAFFHEVATRRGLRQVVLAHHADDQIETLLMNLLRGTGTHGLAGMRAVTPWRGLEIVRPLLGVWRRDIEAWARAEGIRWREDASNRSTDHFRNRLRHHVLPALEAAAGRDVRAALRRAAVLAAEDDAELAAAATRQREALATTTPPGALEVAGLRALPPALARRVVRDWLTAHHVPEVGFEVVEAALAVARAAGRPASCNVAGGRRVRRRNGVLFLDAQGSALDEK